MMHPYQSDKTAVVSYLDANACAVNGQVLSVAMPLIVVTDTAIHTPEFVTYCTA
jgi:hypothetical protein